MTSLLRSATWVLVTLLVQLNRWRGCRNSAALWTFWTLTLILRWAGFSYRENISKTVKIFLLSVPRVYSQLRREVITEEDSEGDLVETISYILTFVVIIISWILAFFMDAKPVYTVTKGRKSISAVKLIPNALLAADTDGSRHPCPESDSSFPSVITFSWFNSLAWTGYRRALLETDLWQLSGRDQSANVVARFDTHWQPRLKAANLQARVDKNENKSSAPLEHQQQPQVKYKGSTNSPRENLTVTVPLIKSFGWTFAVGLLIKIGHDVCIFIPPMILKRIIAFAEPHCDPSEDFECDPEGRSPLWQGVFYSVSLLLVTILQSLLLSSYAYRMYLIGMWIKSSVISAIYRKSLVVSAESKKSSTSGEIINLMSVDAGKISDILPSLNMLWSSPLQISVAVYLLYQILGPSVFAGLITMIVLVPLNGSFAGLTQKFQIKMMKQKDQRVKKMTELLSGMKILKLYAWEPSFMKDVEDTREKELKILLNIGYLNAAINFVMTCAPFLVSLVTFAVYVLSDENNVLDAQKAFTSIALFNILRCPLNMFPSTINSVVAANVSLKRINKFLRNDELDTEAVTKTSNRDNHPASAVTLTNASFNWGDEDMEVCPKMMQSKGKNAEDLGNGHAPLLSPDPDTTPSSAVTCEHFHLEDIR